MSHNFALLESPTCDEENLVKPPRAARNCKDNHRYDPTILNNKAVGYVRVRYEHQDYPRMMYHPEWGAKPRPEAVKYFVGAVTAEQMQNAMKALTEADQKWARGNRTKMAETKADEARLAKKGWLLTPPARELNPQFDLNSDEL